MSKSKAYTEERGTLAAYIAGFILSVLLTLAAYYAVVNNIFASKTLSAFVLLLAVVQLIVQLVLFLHIGKEQKPRHKLSIMLYAVVVLCCIFFGTVWIMYNLDYNMMPPSTQEVQKDERIDL